MKDKLLKIINYYGIYNQLKYIHSEYFELDEAIINFENSTNFAPLIILAEKKHIAEEIADILVMLKQIQLHYDIPNDIIKKIMNEKIDRQIKRIEEEEKNDSAN